MARIVIKAGNKLPDGMARICTDLLVERLNKNGIYCCNKTYSCTPNIDFGAKLSSETRAKILTYFEDKIRYINTYYIVWNDIVLAKKVILNYDTKLSKV